MRHLQLRFTPELSAAAHGGFMAVCREFGLAAGGETEDEARNQLKVIIASFSNALKRQGLLNKALSESGMEWEWIDAPGDADIVTVRMPLEAPNA